MAYSPLPIRQGLNPSRVAAPYDIRAFDFITHLITTQHRRHPDDDERAIAHRFKEGLVLKDSGIPVEANEIIPAGEFISFYRRPAPEPSVPYELRLLYQDNNILVVDKPPFLSSMPRGQHITETAIVRARKELGIPDLSPAHRLDRLTRGLLLFTTRREVRGSYQQLFEKHEVIKTYRGISAIPAQWYENLNDTGHDIEHNYRGDHNFWEEKISQKDFFLPEGALSSHSPTQYLPCPTEDNPWILEHQIVKEYGRMASTVLSGKPNARTVITSMRITNGCIHWSFRPVTGKTHQLRLHSALLGAPLINDPIYGYMSREQLQNPDAPLPTFPESVNEDYSRPLGLIAQSIRFTDPFTGEERYFESTYC